MVRGPSAARAAGWGPGRRGPPGRRDRGPVGPSSWVGAAAAALLLLAAAAVRRGQQRFTFRGGVKPLAMEAASSPPYRRPRQPVATAGAGAGGGGHVGGGTSAAEAGAERAGAAGGVPAAAAEGSIDADNDNRRRQPGGEDEAVEAVEAAEGPEGEAAGEEPAPDMELGVEEAEDLMAAIKVREELERSGANRTDDGDVVISHAAADQGGAWFLVEEEPAEAAAAEAMGPAEGDAPAAAAAGAAAEGAPECEDAKTVAVLITGQLKRFTWKEERGPLVGAADPGCPPVVDVFLTLQRGRIVENPLRVDGRMHISGVPYEQEATVETLERWYRQRGARAVHVEWVMFSEVERMEVAVVEAFDEAERREVDLLNPLERWLFTTLLRQMYMRHRVLRLAMGGDEERRARPYDGFTLWREDNFFFTPLPEQFVPFDVKVDVGAGAPGQQKPQPAVVVDQYCGWGALSDKIFAANAAGAALLFDPTWAAFVAKMKAYAREATLNRARGFNKQEQKFHPESWYQVVMARGGTRVEKRDLRRADVRYVLGRFCAAKMYAHCSPAGVGSDIPVCPGKTADGRFHERFARWVLAPSLAQLKRDPLRMAADFDKLFVVGRLKPGAVKRVRVARRGRAKEWPSAADLLAGRGRSTARRSRRKRRIRPRP